jgi:hypothetical protein
MLDIQCEQINVNHFFLYNNNISDQPILNMKIPRSGLNMSSRYRKKKASAAAAAFAPWDNRWLRLCGGHEPTTRRPRRLQLRMREATAVGLNDGRLPPDAVTAIWIRRSPGPVSHRARSLLFS